MHQLYAFAIKWDLLHLLPPPLPDLEFSELSRWLCFKKAQDQHLRILPTFFKFYQMYGYQNDYKLYEPRFMSFCDLDKLKRSIKLMMSSLI